jgi:hypothetical protein
MMSLFYATVGIGFRIGELGRVGGPVLTVIGVTLAVHLAVTFAGCRVWNSLVSARQTQIRSTERGAGGMGGDPATSGTLLSDLDASGADRNADMMVDVDTLVVASNACVGGAATAAQMASAITAERGSRYSGNRSSSSSSATGGGAGLALAASAAGILGYVIGTPLGLSVAKLLHFSRP